MFFFFGKMLSAKYGDETLADRMKTFGSTQSGYVPNIMRDLYYQ